MLEEPNVEELLKLLDSYEARFLNSGGEPGTARILLLSQKDMDLEQFCTHGLTMIPQMREFLREKRFGKFFRWLGFIQGGMWVLGVFSIEEMATHNRGICSSRVLDKER